MVLRARTGGGIGTNQYRIQGQAVVQTVAPPMVQQSQNDLLAVSPAGELPWENPEVRQYLQDHGLGHIYEGAPAQVHEIRQMLQAGGCPAGAAITAWSAMHRWSFQERTELAISRVLPLEAQIRVATDIDDPRLVRPMAERADCPPRLFPLWAGSIFGAVREQAAAGPNCPAELLDPLARDIDLGVSRHALANYNCPISTIEKFADRPDRAEAISNNYHPDMPQEVLRRIAQFSQAHTGLAVNPHTPSDLLQQVAIASPGVHGKILENPALDTETLKAVITHIGDSELASIIVEHPALDAQCLGLMAKSGSYKLRVAAAGHRDCADADLIKMAASSRGEIKIAVANNSKAPAAALALLIADPSASIRQAVLHNPNLPDHVRAVAVLAGQSSKA